MSQLPERFEYFMVRLTRPGSGPGPVVGLVERLGTGEKRNFQTGEQLLALVTGWSVPLLNLETGTPTGNAAPMKAPPSEDA